MCYRELWGAAIDGQMLERLCDRRWVTSHATKIHKDRINVVAELVLELAGQPHEVVIKYFGWRNRLSYWLSPCMRSRAKKSWDASWWLIRHGIPVPQPLAVFTRRRLGFIQQNFLLTEKIQDHSTARQFLKQAPDFKQKQAFVWEISQLIRRLHAGHFLHRDLTLGNFLLAGRDHRDIYLVDLNRLVRRVFLTPRQRMRDIARMNLCACRLGKTHHDCLWETFLQGYEPEQVDRNRKLLFKALHTRQQRQALKRSAWWGKK